MDLGLNVLPKEVRRISTMELHLDWPIPKAMQDSMNGDARQY